MVLNIMVIVVDIAIPFMVLNVMINVVDIRYCISGVKYNGKCS